MCILQNNTIGWCVECKKSVRTFSNHVFKNGLYFHLFCYLQKLGVVLPLDFEDPALSPENDEE